MKILVVFLILFGLIKNINADEPKPSDSHQFNFFSGVFDINTSSKKSSELFGIQHSNEDLFRDTFLGKLSPITGFMMTADSTSYLYTGVQAEYKIGKLNLTPSFDKALRCRSTGLVPIAHPPGNETFAFPNLASKGPSTNIPALIVFTKL